MSPKVLGRGTALAALFCLGSTDVRADAVTYWNALAQAAIAAGRPGPVGTFDSALVQGAVYDAVQSIERKFKPYHVRIRGASGSPAAAAAAAAHGVLAGLYPSQASPPQTPPLTALDPALEAYLTDNGLVGDPGIAVGEQVAAVYLQLYRAAPANPPVVRGCEDSPPCGPGEWRPTPNYIGNPPAPPAPMLAPWAASITPFTLIRGSQFRPGPPPRLSSRRYLREYEEVKALGASASTSLTQLTRTDEQTALAYFWSENFLAQWNRALRAIADEHLDDIADSARLFALGGFVAADAFITAWDTKLHYNFWRPVTAIQEGDTDGNPDTTGDPDWTPLINTPPYPDYTSGANNLTGGFTRVLRRFFGKDKFDFTMTSNAPQLGAPEDSRRTRTFERFTAVADEVVEARIFLGIHFRTADVVARRQGEGVADWVFDHFLQPVRRHHGHGHDRDDDDNDDDKDDRN